MDTEELYFLAKEHYDNNDTEAALAQLDELVAREYVPACVLKASILIGQEEKQDEIISLYHTAIKVEPTSKEHRLALVDAYLSKAFSLFGDEEAQAKYYQMAITECDYITNEMESDTYPEDWIAGAYEKKGISYGALQKYEEAVQNYDMARLMSPRYSHLLTIIASLKAEQLHDKEGALATLDEYVAYCETNKDVTVFENTLAEAYYHRGKLKIEHLHQKEAGLQDLAKAVEFEPSDFYKEEYESAK